LLVVLCAVLLELHTISPSQARRPVKSQEEKLYDDELFCLGRDPVTSIFCFEELPSARVKFMQESLATMSMCTWSRRERSQVFPVDFNAHANVYQKKFLPLWATHLMPPPPAKWGERPVDHGTFVKNPINATLSMCQTHLAKVNWSFERVGPFTSMGGFDWTSFGWGDAGGFASHLDEGSVFVTGYAFGPCDDTGSLIGLPPIHIHHSHVSSSQHLQGLFMPLHQGADHHGSLNSEGQFAIEFDLHGDRQCDEQHGGLACLGRAFPSGFGMLLSDPLQTFADLNDARGASSPPITFYAQHIYRWTRQPQRRVGRMNSGGIGASPTHDDFFLMFDTEDKEYILWGSRFMPVSARFVSLFWHTHHADTQDIWCISSSPSVLGLVDLANQTASPSERKGLDGARFSSRSDMLLNLRHLKMNIPEVMRYIILMLQAAAAECALSTCSAEPRLRCSLHPDRWEVVAGSKIPHERYHLQHCDSWQFEAGDIFTVISFHKRLFTNENMSLVQHSVMYGVYVGEENVAIPHSFVPIMPR